MPSKHQVYSSAKSTRQKAHRSWRRQNKQVVSKCGPNSPGQRNMGHEGGSGPFNHPNKNVINRPLHRCEMMPEVIGSSLSNLLQEALETGESSNNI